MRLVWLAGFFGSPLLLHAAIVGQSSMLMTGFAVLIALLFFLRGQVPAVMVAVMALASLGFGALAWVNVEFSTNLALLTQSSSYLLVAWLFGRTLRRGRTPLISTMAAFEHGGTLPPELAPYTRRVNWFWTLLMAAMSIAALLLGRFASAAAWSWFTNVVSWLVIGAGYFGEYFYRLWRWPNYRHTGPIRTLINIIARAPEYFGVDSAAMRAGDGK
jgi:uncharacterized membrane protein